MTTAALLLAALLAGLPGGIQPRPAEPTSASVLAEMAPAPGHWEAEDAPAYFSDRADITDAPAPGDPVALGDAAPAGEPRQGEALVARSRP